jgi:DHA1 family bicyclomycin/chloramphenicol resistance-like MFS transporter
MSSLVFQEQYGLSPQAFSLVFAINSVGIVIGTQVNRSLVRRFTLSAIALAALGLAVIAALSLTVAAWLGLAIIALLVPLFVATMAQGAIGPDITAIALEPYARGAGAAAAILGTVQFLIGAIIPPLASIGGTSAIVMGVTMTACLLAALVVLGLQVRSASNKARGESAHPEVAAGDIGPA